MVTSSRRSASGVTVIIPVKNTQKYLAQAIDSVLGQTAPPAELIVVDDGSTDGSLDVARSYGTAVRIVEGAPGGIGATRNVGVTHATGRLLAFLDADDYWAREKLEWQLDAREAHSSVDAVFGGVHQFYSPEVDVAAEERERLAGECFSGVHAGTMLITAEAFRRVGPFDPLVRVGEFLDWYARALEAGLTFDTLPQVVMWRRIHDRNTVAVHRSSQRDYVRILKAALDRRRGQSDGSAASV